jgi:glycerol-3-phosphate cytidylyltransferase
MIVMTFGTYDILHYGHVRILKRARELGNQLIVGVSSDDLNFSKKGRFPVYSQKERMAIISSIRYVDDVFIEESLELKRQYLIQHKADILVMGDDWAGRFDEFSDICQVVYLPRTPSISTTSVIETVKSMPD